MSNRSRTPNTPFIPPLGSPDGSPAPVVPNLPSNRHSPNPAHAYLHSPYATTPFVPPANISPMGTPGVIPSVIPGGAQPRGLPPRQGVSADFVGYPNGVDPWTAQAQGLPSTPMLGYGNPMSPWHPQTPASAPAAYPNFNTPWNPSTPLPSQWSSNPRGIPPPVPPPGHGGYSPYSPFTPAYPPPGQLPGGHGGAPPAWGMQGMGMHPQMHPPMGPPHHGYFGAQCPPDWVQQGFGPPPHINAPPPPQRVAPENQRTDQVSPFAIGPHYGPVLDPSLIHILGVQLRINPLLMPLPEDGSDQVHLNWNMLFPTSDVQRSSDPSHISWSKGRDEPATFPRVTQLSIVTESLPWIIEARATEKARGLTCGELIDAIGRSLGRLASEADYRLLSSQAKRDLKFAYEYNRQRHQDVPGGKLGAGMKRLDYLGRSTMFAGIELNDRVVRRMHGMALPCFVVMRTSPSYPMTEKERRDQEARQKSASSHGHRSRAGSVNARITVESPSSTGGSDTDSADYDR
ncbi:hypothetical protein JR316_0003121 [Psilocybe cubensis]|uniref:DUF6699 domain-containing protein n=2 Tax=Psilocybe cubensis TaxID=181762 RepID=A0A8H8CNG4_PSICU|nr:hypothetical protein JR316_0003121 [Psilocybe cubensis]KAH9483651.1 hypothetical protein JR316_0003121 [Psilocybe cubensis]